MKFKYKNKNFEKTSKLNFTHSVYYNKHILNKHKYFISWFFIKIYFKK